MKKTFLLLSAFFVCSFCFQLKAANFTYYVSPTGDDTSNDGLTATAPFMTISKVNGLLSAGQSAIIYLEEDAVFTERVFFDKSGIELEIIGNNTKIVRPTGTGGWDQTLRFNNVSVVKLKGITVENSSCKAIGGVIFASGQDMEVEDCIFKNNSTIDQPIGGSVIASRTVNLIIKNCYFENNKSLTGTGTGNIAYAGAILHSGVGGEFLVENSTFVGNTVDKSNSDAAGSAFYFFESSPNIGPARITIRNNTFYNNTTTSTGSGGTAVFTLNAGMTVADAYVVNNTFLFDERGTGTETPAEIYKKNVIVRLEGTAHKLHLINNVISGYRFSVAATTAASGREAIVAKNNYAVVMGEHANATDIANGVDGNIVISEGIVGTWDALTTTNINNLDANMATTGLATSLSTDKTIPYIAIQSLTSPLVDAGLATYLISSEELIPANDILGTLRASSVGKTGDAVDIGAFEYVNNSGSGTILPQNLLEEQILVFQQNNEIIINNNGTEKNMILAIMQIDGRKVAEMQVAGSLSISKNMLPKGALIFMFDNGIAKTAKKIVVL